MIRICRLSATSQYMFFFLKMSDSRIHDDFPRYHSIFGHDGNPLGHNIPQGLNFREKQSLVIPVQSVVATLSVNNKLIQWVKHMKILHFYRRVLYIEVHFFSPRRIAVRVKGRSAGHVTHGWKDNILIQ